MTIRKLIGFGLLVILSASTSAQTHKSTKSPHQLRSDLNSIQHKKATLRRQLAQARVESHEVQVDIHHLDTNLSGLEDDLEATKNSLAVSVSEQTQLSRELSAATVRVGQVREQVRKRLRYMYMHQGESVLTAFTGAKSVGDIASRKVILEAIARKDRALFTEFRELQATISGHKHRQDIVVAHVQDLKERQVAYQSHLEVARNQKGVALKSLQSKQDQIKQWLSQLEEDEASVYAQIRAYEAMASKVKPKPGTRAPVPFVGRFLRPAQGPITSGFGMRMHPILHYRRLHAGIDFGAPYGSPIRAAGDGVVIVAQYSRSFGNMVIIDHGNGVSTLYAHASHLYVHQGQVVKRGQTIAAIGQTGLANGPHLHWEVRINGHPVNPMGRF